MHPVIFALILVMLPLGHSAGCRKNQEPGDPHGATGNGQDTGSQQAQPGVQPTNRQPSGDPSQPPMSEAVTEYVAVAAPTVALTNVRVIDGTGAPARENQTIVLRGDTIQAVDRADRVQIAKGAKVLDLAGKSVTPGFVMVHEHMFYPVGERHYGQHGFSFPKLYLGGGATTIRTAGSMSPYADLNLKDAIDRGALPGPNMDVTGPFLEGPGLPILQVKALRGPEDARNMVRYWADEGATSFKVYMHIRRDELKAAVEAAHERGYKVTGHLCSVTFREAATLGIDNLEHGFVASTDFVADKVADVCPPRTEVLQSLRAVDADSDEMQALFKHLIAHKVAITSTLPIFETYTPGRPAAAEAALAAMVPELRQSYTATWSKTAAATDSVWVELLAKEMALERAFVRAGGTLLVGTDPTGYGGVVPGFANQRAIELLVEAGFSPVEAIRIATLEGARYLGRDDTVGTIEVGKKADLVVIGGNPIANIADIGKVELVFKNGIGYDSQRLMATAKGRIGLH